MSEAYFIASREESARMVSTLEYDKIDRLESAYRGDPWAFGTKTRWMYQEAVRRGWLLGPA